MTNNGANKDLFDRDLLSRSLTKNIVEFIPTFRSKSYVAILSALLKSCSADF